MGWTGVEYIGWALYTRYALVGVGSDLYYLKVDAIQALHEIKGITLVFNHLNKSLCARNPFQLQSIPF